MDYAVKIQENKITIFDAGQTLEKSIRLGYLNYVMQRYALGNTFAEQNVAEAYGLQSLSDILDDAMAYVHEEQVGTGVLARYILQTPQALFEVMGSHPFTLEETFTIADICKEFHMENDAALADKKITQHCSLMDVLYFHRFFNILYVITSKAFHNKGKRDQKKVIASLLPHYSDETLLDLLEKFVGSKEKAQELLDLFTYKKAYKLDLQYTPLLNSLGGKTFSCVLTSTANLMRNAIAYSHLANNQIVNDDGREPLVELCAAYFEKAGYTVRTNKKFKYMGCHGEIDVIAVNGQDILLMECKSPLSPSSTFELRASILHIEKANKQLNLSSTAFADKAFVRKFFKDNELAYSGQGIRTCIIFGNRLLCGYKKAAHPIRFVHELGMVLTEGRLKSSFGDWSVWQGDRFCHEDLLRFLDDSQTYLNHTFDVMEKSEAYLYVKGKKISFVHYATNIVRLCERYDKNLPVVSRNYAVRQEVRNEFLANGLSCDL